MAELFSADLARQAVDEMKALDADEAEIRERMSEDLLRVREQRKAAIKRYKAQGLPPQLLRTWQADEKDRAKRASRVAKLAEIDLADDYDLFREAVKLPDDFNEPPRERKADKADEALNDLAFAE